MDFTLLNVIWLLVHLSIRMALYHVDHSVLRQDQTALRIRRNLCNSSLTNDLFEKKILEEANISSNQHQSL